MGLDGGHLAVVENFPHILTTFLDPSIAIMQVQSFTGKGTHNEAGSTRRNTKKNKVTVGLAKKDSMVATWK